MKGKKHQDFILIRTWPGKKLGTTLEYHRLVRCPNCHYEFVQDISEGCFHHNITPWACPNCNYPWIYYEKLREKIFGKKSQKFNPSKRET